MSLGALRQKIDEVDTEILDLFQQRMDIVAEVAEYKLQRSEEVLQPEREVEILEKRESQARPQYAHDVKDLFKELMRLSRRMQLKIIEDNKKPPA